MRATFNLKEFKRVITALKPFTGEVLGRSRMENINIKIDSGKQEAKFEALDGHRLAIEYLPCDTDESFEVCVKPTTFMKSDSDIAEVILKDGIAYTDMGNYILKTPQPVEEWYKTEKILEDIENEKAVLKVGVNAGLLIDALNKVKRTTSGKNGVIIECRNERSPIVIRDMKERRNVRLVLPMTFPDSEEG